MLQGWLVMYVGSMTQWVGTRQAGAQRGGLGQGNWHVTGLVEVRWGRGVVM